VINTLYIYMENLNLGFLVSSVIAMTGLGVYVLYMNNEENNILKEPDVNDEDSSNDDESDYIKNTKKSVTVKTKRRANKSLGTRRRRY